jgi:DNA repair exonuclease SbcCD ATPase subunit
MDDPMLAALAAAVIATILVWLRRDGMIRDRYASRKSTLRHSMRGTSYLLGEGRATHAQLKTAIETASVQVAHLRSEFATLKGDQDAFDKVAWTLISARAVFESALEKLEERVRNLPSEVRRLKIDIDRVANYPYEWARTLDGKALVQEAEELISEINTLVEDAADVLSTLNGKEMEIAEPDLVEAINESEERRRHYHYQHYHWPWHASSPSFTNPWDRRYRRSGISPLLLMPRAG